MIARFRQVSLFVGLCAAVPAGAALPHGTLIERGLDSLQFPRHRATSDVGDILDAYPDYLQFVLEVGKSSNPKLARELGRRYMQLRKADERYAARFLKGLRFEMHQKLEMVGYPPDRVTTNHPGIRKWVNRYLGVWLREVDEYQFRAYAASVAKKSR